METLIIFIVALGLSMDCFSLAIVNSAVSGEVKPGISLQASMAFALAHVLLMLLGYWVAGLLAGLFAGMELWAAFIVFVVIGAKMIREAVRRKPEARVFNINSGRVILALAVAASIDAFLAGIAFGIVGMRLSLTLVVVAIATFLFTLSGLAGGNHFGMEFARRTGVFGGVFMLITAFHFVAGIVF